MTNTLTGTCKWFDLRKGHGFITTESGQDVFVHYTGIEVEGFKVIYENDKVEFALEDDKNNRKHAIHVKVVESARRTRGPRRRPRKPRADGDAAQPAGDGAAGGDVAQPTEARAPRRRAPRTRKPRTENTEPKDNSAAPKDATTPAAGEGAPAAGGRGGRTRRGRGGRERGGRGEQGDANGRSRVVPSEGADNTNTNTTNTTDDNKNKSRNRNRNRNKDESAATTPKDTNQDPNAPPREKKRRVRPRRVRPAGPRRVPARTVHYVIRNSDLKPTVEFFKQVFGMKVLRHEENNEACKITCNGRYNNAWSKTMIGYDTEDKAYCLEVTYNYGVLNYPAGNGLQHIAIGVDDVSAAVSKAKELGYKVDEALNLITGPDNYKYLVVPKVRKEQFDHVKLRVSNVDASLKFYTETLGMKDLTSRFKVDSTGATKHAVVGYSLGTVPLFLFEDGTKVQIQAFEGRHAISMKEELIKDIYAKLDKDTQVVHALQELEEKLGKLVITIVKDLDGYEHCLVNSELFDKAAASSADFVEPDWQLRRKFIDERATKDAKGKSS